jgi:hypothetical protein
VHIHAWKIPRNVVAVQDAQRFLLVAAAVQFSREVSDGMLFALCTIFDVSRTF